ncbi:unnamed protein product [Soboliphyme baturini]|uniref:LAM_G_DOMAIN domain-containing protein n=1 Tax=Soboliphyme baturini TaxID=241478 RepID=A0A183IR33_9BILA|nr:unnamed protein product [Soboliphyme baturini]
MQISIAVSADYVEFRYVDDLVIAVQDTHSAGVKESLTEVFEKLDHNFRQWSLKPNPNKIEVPKLQIGRSLRLAAKSAVMLKVSAITHHTIQADRMLVATICYFLMQLAVSVAGGFYKLTDESLLNELQGSNVTLSQHHVCQHSQNHLLYFALVGVDQPNFSGFHYTLLLGSYVIDFDLGSNTSHITKYSAMDYDENSDHVMFTIDDIVYLVSYKQYRKCSVDTVELRQNQDCSFKRMNISPKVVLLSVLFPRGRVLFFKIYQANGVLNFHLLYSVKKILTMTRAKIAYAAKFNDSIVVIPTVLGCGYKWFPNKPLLIELDSGNTTQFELQGPTPQWSFNGPVTVLQKGSHLLLIGGNVATGLSSVKFSPEIWTFDMLNMTYTKLPLSVPKPVANFKACSCLDQMSGNLFISDIENGVFAATVDL